MNLLLVAIVILTGAAGDVSVTRGMKSVGEVSDFHISALLRAAVRTTRNGFIWLGIFWKTISFFSFLALLSRADLSWAMPACSLNYAVDSLAAKYLLKEKVSSTRWAGVLCVGMGVALISL